MAGPPAAEAIWSALISEPQTGVGIISLDGRVIWLNEQAARIFHGPRARPEQFIGKHWRDLQPPEWVEQRLAVLRRVHESGRPVMMRTIWRGWQQLTWVHEIGEDLPEEMSPDDGEPGTAPVRFLTITRRVPGDPQAEALTSLPAPLVESEVADLGPLDVLSSRELEVLALFGHGLRVEQIARLLHRSAKTIANHRMSIGMKLGLNDRAALAEAARRAGLTVADAERIRL